MQAAHDGALSFDDFAHAFELAGMGVAPSLVAQQLAFFGVSLFELDALGLGRLNQFDSGGFQQLAVCGMGNGFLLYGGDAMDASLPTGTETRLLNADGMSRRLSGRETSSNRGGSSDGYGIKVPMA